MPRGQKSCSGCSAKLGPRQKICPYCQKVLISDLKYSKIPPKVVESCQKALKEYEKGNWEDVNEIINHLKEEIKDEEQEHLIKTLPEAKKAKIDWHTLEKGDIIKVSQMGGPYWKTRNGEEINMGDHGTFKVVGHDKNGIHCIGTGKKCGRFYLYMGEKELCEKTGLTKYPHVILKVKKAHKEEKEED